MKNKSIEIEFIAGNNIEDAMHQLSEVSQKYNAKAFGEFNGKVISSDMSIDEAYKLITNETKSENEARHKHYLEELDKEEKEHKEKIPKLTEEWREKARGVVRPEKLDMWDKIVPIRLGDLYRGMELGCTLKLVKMLDIDKCSLEDAKNEFCSQGHSGISAGLMFSMMKEFCTMGEEFVSYVRY